MVSEFFAGMGTLLRGFGLWRTRSGLMALGLLPAAIAFALLAGALIPLAFSLGGITEWITPFADGWVAGWRTALRTAIGAVIFVVALMLAGIVFSALALVIGDPFYEKIWRAVENDLGSPPAEGGGRFWTSVGEALRLVLLGILFALLTLLIGLIPVVGGALAAVTGVVLTGRLLARELTGRAFDARDFDQRTRAVLFSGSRARVLGFGVATQLCFLIPLGAVLTMPAAVGGSTMLARDMMVRAESARPASPTEPGRP